MAAILPIVTDDAPTSPDPTPDPLKVYRAKGKWVAVNQDTLRDLIELAREAADGPLPEKYALVDLHYWHDRGEPLSRYRAAERWGWTERKARAFIASHSCPIGVPSASHDSAKSEEKEGKTSHPRPTSVPSASHPPLYTPRARQTTDIQKDKTVCANARARETFGPFDPRGDGVTVTAMIEWGKVDGVPEDVCREVYDSATAMNWTNKGSPITDARAWLRYCNTYRKSHTTTSNATHRTNPGSPPNRRDRGKEVYASARANRAKLYGLDDPNAAVPGADEYGIPVAGDG